MDPDTEYRFDIQTYTATKKITVLLLMMMYTELNVKYKVFQMDPTLLKRSWKRMINKYSNYDMSISKWIDLALRHVSYNNFAFGRSANCWEFIRSYLALYIGIFHKCDIKPDYDSRSNCIQISFDITWQYFLNKHIRHALIP